MTLASVYACARQNGKMVGVPRQAAGVNAVALKEYLDDKPQGDDRSASAPRRRVNLPEGVEEAEEMSHSLLGVAMSRIASGEDKEAVLALEIALQLNLNNSPAMMLLTATYLLWGKAARRGGARARCGTYPGWRRNCSADESGTTRTSQITTRRHAQLQETRLPCPGHDDQTRRRR